MANFHIRLYPKQQLHDKERSVETMARTSLGVVGLDEILRGGLLANQSWMVRGGPGPDAQKGVAARKTIAVLKLRTTLGETPSR